MRTENDGERDGGGTSRIEQAAREAGLLQPPLRDYAEPKSLRPFDEVRAEARPAVGGWYVVQVQEGPFAREPVAIDRLRRLRFEFYRPCFKKRIGNKRLKWQQRRRPEKMIQVERPLFPGYVFVLAETASVAAGVRHVDGVVGVLGCGGRPEPVSDSVIAMLHAASADNFGLDDATGRHGFKAGEIVRLTEGVWTGYNAAIVSLDESERVSLLLSMFGREVRVLTTTDMIEGV